jgi:hypothetical protein
MTDEIDVSLVRRLLVAQFPYNACHSRDNAYHSRDNAGVSGTL